MDDVTLGVLRKYPKALLALRGAFRDRLLGLMLGAGVTRAFDFDGKQPPKWDELVEALERELNFDGTDGTYRRLSATQKVEVLFRSFQHSEGINAADADASAAAHGRWRALIRKHLYDGAPPPNRLVGLHPYMASLMKLVLASPMSVTYNFDSYLEECLSQSPKAAGAKREEFRRPFESISDVTLPQRPSKAVIYHINGYLPRDPLETASNHLVFSEGEFSSQLIMAMAGKYATLAHHFVNNVYLLVGLSGDDPNLRHQLRTSSILSPGRVHFIVRYVAEPRELVNLTDAEKGVAEAGFDLHNLYSLYLTSAEVNALFELIQMDEVLFSQAAGQAGVATKYVYYLSGIPGIGKTTVLRHIGGLFALDEWVETPNFLLSRPYKELTSTEREKLDSWVADQFKLKNKVLNSFDEGIFVVERAPLDPLAFEDVARRASKAEVFQRIFDSDDNPIQRGQVIFLHGDTRTVERRIANRQAEGQRSDYLDMLQDQLRNVYQAPGTLEWRSTEWSIETLVRSFSSLVYNEPYEPVDLQARLGDLAQS